MAVSVKKVYHKGEPTDRHYLAEGGGIEVAEWWLYQLSITDRTNIVCFLILMIISVIDIVIVKKMKLPVWKFQVGGILLMDIIGVALLVIRLSNG